MIVGRDTDTLDDGEVSRAAVETVAESSVDGVTAPLFWGVLLGPAGMAGYKAINTLDSMWGHRNERFRYFGWAAARLDDVANLLPARLTAPCIVLAAAILGLRPVNALVVCLRDGGKHLSPNSGIPEAAFAGALGVQFGGVNRYHGEVIERTRIGVAHEVLGAGHIHRANHLMLTSAVLASALFLGLRSLLP